MKRILSIITVLSVVFALFSVTVSAAYEKKVKKQLKSITITINQTKQLKIINKTGKEVKWSTSNSSIVVVNSKGEVTGKSEGRATVTASMGANKLRCVITVKPLPTVPEGVTIIGDSASLGAQSTLINTIPDCYYDGAVSRQLNVGRDIMLDLQSRGQLREYVVIALGTNGHYNYVNIMTEIIEKLNPGHRLIFVTPFDGRSNENAQWVNKIAQWLKGLPEQYDFITIADWNSAISTQTHLLAKDTVHMGGQTSMTLYTNCIVEAIEKASEKPAKSEF